MFALLSFSILFIFVLNFDGTQSQCDADWSYFSPTNKCLRYYPKLGNWTTASDHCKAIHDGDLASLHSLDEYVLANELKGKRHFAWIGLLRIYDYDMGPRRMWVDNSSLNFDGPQAPGLEAISHLNAGHSANVAPFGVHYPGIKYEILSCYGLDTFGYWQSYDCGAASGEWWSDGGLCSYHP